MRRPLNNQPMSMGVSPLVTIQLTEAALPVSKASSPNSNGRMIGTTSYRWRDSIGDRDRISRLVTYDLKRRRLFDAACAVTRVTGVVSGMA